MEETALCLVCRGDAIARMHGDWLCARCGLQRTADAARSSDAGRTRWWQRPAALRTAVGSGLAAKVLIGAAAVAAVGGAVVSNADPQAPPPHPVANAAPADVPPSAPPFLPPPGPENPPPGTALPAPSGTGDPAAVAAFIAAMREWSACIDAAVHAFAAAPPGSGFDPFAACPDRPTPPGHGAEAQGRRPDWAGRPDDPGSKAADGPQTTPPRGGPNSR